MKPIFSDFPFRVSTHSTLQSVRMHPQRGDWEYENMKGGKKDPEPERKHNKNVITIIKKQSRNSNIHQQQTIQFQPSRQCRMMLFLPITQNIVWLQFCFFPVFWGIFTPFSSSWHHRCCLAFRSRVVFITSSNRIELHWTARRHAIRTHSIATKPKLKIYFYYSSKRFIQRKILRDYNCVPFNREKCNYIPISVFYWLTRICLLACLHACSLSCFVDWIGLDSNLCGIFCEIISSK